MCSRPISPGSMKHSGGFSALSGCGHHELRAHEPRILHSDQSLTSLQFVRHVLPGVTKEAPEIGLMHFLRAS